MELNLSLFVEKIAYIDGNGGNEERCFKCEMKPKRYYKVYGDFSGNMTIDKDYLLFCNHYCLPKCLENCHKVQEFE